MKKTLIILIALLAAVGFTTRAELTADWRMHLPFDDWATKVIETPERVYFLGRTFEHNPAVSGRDVNAYSLHYYDIKGDEVITMSTDKGLSDNIISCVAYNPGRGYMIVAYTNCNIDFIYDNGKIENVSALKMLSIPGKKEVNSITFDNPNYRAYLATSFGYVTLNTSKHEIAESRTYNEPIKSAARCGDNVVLVTDDYIYSANLQKPRFSLSEYEKSDNGERHIDGVYPVTDEFFLGVRNGQGGNIYRGEFPGGDSTIAWTDELVNENFIIDVAMRKSGGYQVTGNVNIYYFSLSKTSSLIGRPNDAWRKPAASEDGQTLWSLVERKGLRKYEKTSDGKWVVAKDYMRPNSPATYISTSMAYHPEFGMLAGSNGVDMALSIEAQSTPNQISALKSGWWKEYSPLYTNPEGMTNNNNFSGLTIDPKNTNHVYRGSYFNGLLRLNLKDPSDILIMGQPSNRNKDKKGFIPIVEDRGWEVLCHFTDPQFDTEGTMWSLYYNSDNKQDEIFYWTAADRAATTSAASYRPMKRIVLKDMPGSNSDVMLKLIAPKNQNLIAVGGDIGNYGSVLIYDTSNNRSVLINRPLDQDGGNVSFLVVNKLWEDPATGLLWIMTQRGLFTVNPATAFENPRLVNRIKVSRNDGTQLADYLLNEVNVNDLTVDGEGRKWFSTSNGLVCTSSDGRTVYGEFSTANSPLPDDNVYVARYNPENNSLLLGTGQGLVEMYPSGSGQNSGSGNSGPRIYPNPVEPDYFGWVHIDNISDGSLVKITDAQGGLVKELGTAQGGSVEWDVTNMHNSRVSTGVYYVMVSPGNGMSGQTSVSKILVLN